MSSRGCLVAALILLACEEDPAAACDDARAVHLLATDTDWPWVARPVGDRTVLAIAPVYGYHAPASTHIGAACGVEPTPVLFGAAMLPASVAVDPDDDDPSIACDLATDRFYRLDLTGASPPTLLLPHLDCDWRLTTARGPVFHGHDKVAPLWLVPDFPDDATAVPIAHAVRGVPQVQGERLYYLDGDGALTRLDLATGVETRLLAGVEHFVVREPHALWRPAVAGDAAPVHLLDLETGASRYLGLAHDGEFSIDYAGPGDTLPWDFDPSGEFVVHVPQGTAAQPMAAFDLRGVPVEFPAFGTPRGFLGDGRFVHEIGPEVFAARPGGAPVRLDVPLAGVAAPIRRHDHLEVLVGDDLYRVPGDGAPRTRVATDVGPKREWLDDEHLLTIHDHSLVTLHVASNTRTARGLAVVDYQRFPDRGVYFMAWAGEDQPDNGIYFVPEATLRPVATHCKTGITCR